MKFVWVVKVGKQRCTFEHFSEAWYDYKSHDKAMLYPKLMSKTKFANLKDFEGW
jgi:hypothetical protein